MQISKQWKFEVEQRVYLEKAIESNTILKALQKSLMRLWLERLTNIFVN